ncbi:hypothetical protein [Rhizobium sp. 18055]|uniref:hypothetical protein n=1 Tax=Rhizobium sp. 18055 TaxID=2681403 RepID=UPI0013587A29|nr:hypothetical protein [Rhizobium sp. 18055]
MNTVISFHPRDTSPRPTVQDPHGRAELLYVCVFIHQGRKFSFMLAANSWTDAEERLASLRQSIVLDGETHAMGDIDIFLPPPPREV